MRLNKKPILPSLLLLTSIFFLNFFARVIFSPLLPAIEKSLSLSHSKAGTIFLIIGIRFSLLECPNALCWTITTGYPPDSESIIIHLTINRQEKNEEFIEEISEFLDDLCVNLKHFFK